MCRPYPNREESAAISSLARAHDRYAEVPSRSTICRSLSFVHLPGSDSSHTAGHNCRSSPQVSVGRSSASHGQPPPPPGSVVSGGSMSGIPFPTDVSTDAGVHRKGEDVDGSSSPPRSGGDAIELLLDRRGGILLSVDGARDRPAFLPPRCPLCPPGISPTSAVGEKGNRSGASAKPWIHARRWGRMGTRSVPQRNHRSRPPCGRYHRRS